MTNDLSPAQRFFGLAFLAVVSALISAIPVMYAANYWLHRWGKEGIGYWVTAASLYAMGSVTNRLRIMGGK